MKKDIICIEQPKQTCRQMITVDATVWDRWKRFSKQLPSNAAILSYALQKTMDDITESNARISMQYVIGENEIASNDVIE